MSDDSDMSSVEFRLLSDLIHEHCGIRFEESMRFVMARRLESRLRATGCETYTDYYRHLRYSGQRKTEMDEVMERVTTNETYFFREEYQLRAFREEILPMVADAHKADRQVRFWSAGCSSGEEAYTIAMLCRECPALTGYQIEVFGNDISKKVLAQARAGQYSQSAFRSTDRKYLERYFKPIPGGRYEVNEDIRRLVSFGQLNLVDSTSLALVGQNDAIFCRNVMIYFDDRARQIVLKNLYRRLRPKGFLLLGHSESLLNVTTEFEVVSLKNDLVYRRP